MTNDEIEKLVKRTLRRELNPADDHELLLQELVEEHRKTIKAYQETIAILRQHIDALRRAPDQKAGD